MRRTPLNINVKGRVVYINHEYIRTIKPDQCLSVICRWEKQQNIRKGLMRPLTKDDTGLFLFTDDDQCPIVRHLVDTQYDHNYKHVSRTTKKLEGIGRNELEI